jgi:hypothetical protein
MFSLVNVIKLTPEDITDIEMAVPNGSTAGERYAPQQMAHLDSEKGNR